MSNPDAPGQGTRKMHRVKGESAEIRPHVSKRPGLFFAWAASLVLVIHAGTYTLADAVAEHGSPWGPVWWGMTTGGAIMILLQWVRALADWARGR